MDASAPAATESPRIDLVQLADYRFASRFGPGLPELQADEPPPLGTGAGPSPVQLLAAAVANCLSASLVFALRKFRIAAEPIAAAASAVVGRNEAGRLRVQRIAVTLTLGTPAGGVENLERALARFEEFCTVTQSVRAAIPVDVEVRGADGRRLR